MKFFAFYLLTVFIYSLVSRRLERTIFTAPILFTLAGICLFMAFPAQYAHLELNRDGLLLIAEIGLVLTLFTDAAHINLKSLSLIANRNLPIRLLTTGMLLTIVLGAAAAMLVFGQFTWLEAGILAAILAPTDAGLGTVIVNSPLVPARIRQALNIEAGLNDGLSVPFLMCFTVLAQHSHEGVTTVLTKFLIEQIGYGSLIGGVIGLAGGYLLGLACHKQWMAKPMQQLGLVALPLLGVLASEASAASMFIAAYVAGFAVQAGFSEAGRHSVEFTETWGQLFDFFVFFLFGLLFARSWQEFAAVHVIYGLLSLTVVRMLPVALALIGSGLSRSTVLFMGWFGPRGLASIVLGLVYLDQHANLPGDSDIRLSVMMTVLLSIFVHGFSAMPGIRRYALNIATLDSAAPELQQNEPENPA